MTKYIVEDFIEKSNLIEDTDTLFSLFCNVVAQTGYNRIIYTMITDHPSADLKAGHGLLCSYPEEWLSYYVEKKYIQFDPVVQNAHLTRFPFRWNDIKHIYDLSKQESTIMHEAEEAGLYHGIGVPLCGVGTELSGFGLARDSASDETDRNTLSTLHLLATQFHNSYLSLNSSTSKKETPRLTKRECETLQWMAAGKTADEIGIILGCEATTIRSYIRQIYSKLDANSNVYAVTKAIRLGLIQLDLLK